MSDTVKLIIEIPKLIYDRIKYLEPNADTMLDNLMRAVQNGIPLDDVKAEIKQGHCRANNGYDQGRNYGLYMAEQILDNIGKAESEDT